MIPIWLNRNAAKPINDQLVAQLQLGIASGSIAPGDCLPSVRSMARRLGLHPNTVSQAYRELAQSGCVETKRGKGTFARQAVPETVRSIADCARQSLRHAADLGFSAQDLIAALTRLSGNSERTLLVMDPDPELARILAAEVREAIPGMVESIGFEGLPENLPETSLPIVSARQESSFRSRWPSQSFQTLKIRSIPEILAGVPKVDSRSLIAFISHSRVVQQWARTLTAALGVAPESVIYRNPGERNWRAGLKTCSLIAADLLASAAFPEGSEVFVVRLVASSSLQEIRFVC